MTNNNSDYTLRWARSSSKTKIIVRCERDGRTILSDEVAIQREADRSRLANRLEILGCDRATVDSELLEIAGEATQITPRESTAAAIGDEIEPDAVHRPERFLLNGISGLSVPVITRTSDRIAGKLMAYVRVGDDRIRCEMSGEMRLGDQTVYINPVPMEPSVKDHNGWSKSSREVWLAGNSVVDPAELFRRIVSAIDYYIEFGEASRQGALVTLALWIMVTYHYQAWHAIGYLLVNGPQSSGKSTLFRLLKELVFRPFSTENISAAAMYRTLHSKGGTLLYDEAERLRDIKSPDIAEINSMLLAGYKRGGTATRLEKIGDGFETVSFQVFGPKAIACINGVPPTLQSRCIEIATQRASKDSPKPKHSFESTNWQSMRDDLHVMSVDNGDTWIRAASRRDVGESINGRDYELWQPLLAMAAWLEVSGVENLSSLVAEYAAKSIEASSAIRSPEADEILIRTLARIHDRRPTASEILHEAMLQHRTVFNTWSPDGVGRRLRTYGLATTRTNSRREYRQSLIEIVSVCERYSIDLV